MRLTALSLALLVVSAPALAQKVLSATSGWVKAPAAGETSAVAFVTVDNPTMYDVSVVSAASDAAAKVELRRAVKGTNPELVQFVGVPAYDSLRMTPDGILLRLVDLKKPLKVGDHVEISLTTDGDLVVSVTAEVREK